MRKTRRFIVWGIPHTRLERVFIFPSAWINQLYKGELAMKNNIKRIEIEGVLKKGKKRYKMEIPNPFCFCVKAEGCPCPPIIISFFEKDVVGDIKTSKKSNLSTVVINNDADLVIKSTGNIKAASYLFAGNITRLLTPLLMGYGTWPPRNPPADGGEEEEYEAVPLVWFVPLIAGAIGAAGGAAAAFLSRDRCIPSTVETTSTDADGKTTKTVTVTKCP
jgi:hypothetical protein